MSKDICRGNIILTSMNDLKITKILEDGQSAVLTTQQLAVLLNMSASSTAVKLNRLVNRNVLVRVTRGRYCLPSTDILAVASSIYSPSYISLLGAFEFHGTTTQSTRVIDVINPIYSGQISLTLEAGQFIMRFIKVDRSLVFGYEKTFFSGKVALIADKEKVIVDSLFLTGYVTLDETVACLRSKIEYKKAMDYARRIDRQSVIKRLGYLLSTVGIQCPSEYSSGLSKTYVPLDPSLPKRGKYDPKWRIIINRVIE